MAFFWFLYPMEARKRLKKAKKILKVKRPIRVQMTPKMAPEHYVSIPESN